MGWNKKAISYGGPVRVGFWLRTFLAAALCLAFVPVAHSREPVGGARPRAEFSRWQSRYQNHLDVRRGRWRSEVRPHIAARRMTSQNLSEELKKMMTPGLRTQRLSDERRSSMQQRVKAISITSRNKGEFVLPEPPAGAPAQRSRPVSVDETEKNRMKEHQARFEAMSDSQKSKMQKQMRRVRPLSIEERADAVQKAP
ncbi:MAG: hypothetical protein CMN75_04395 [Spirochaeta sp.]|nr:hypothetical protein [Spirochaeta sp.]RPG07251.1 MAG: hypothetical protein CBC32_009870 [Proteobacteria bacterium TMED72]